MCDSKIEIYTLGRFQVKKDDYIITKNNNKSHKVWCLFKILISSPQKVFSTEELMDRLDLSLELIDAKNAVQNLIYRLRKILAKNENYIAEKYIIFEEEGYSFNWRNKHYVDFIEFEKLCKKSEKAEKENKDDQVLDYAIQAIEIYQGDFLNENKEFAWVIQKRAYLRRLYLEQVYIICEILRKKEHYTKIEEICEKALLREPFEEEIHYLLINALIKDNKLQKAKLHYEYIVNLFTINKLKISPVISNLVEEMNTSSEEHTEEINNIKDKIKKINLEEGLHLVDKKTFNFLSWVSIQKKERGEYPIFLISLSLNIDIKSIEIKKYQEIIDYLERILSKKLRNSDVICKWNKKQYLILFTKVELLAIQEIIYRIKKEFYKNDLSEEIIFNIDCIDL